jgi:hypothetical protein
VPPLPTALACKDGPRNNRRQGQIQLGANGGTYAEGPAPQQTSKPDARTCVNANKALESAHATTKSPGQKHLGPTSHLIACSAAFGPSQPMELRYVLGYFEPGRR